MVKTSIDTNDDAVSPVIGVILMVAVAVAMGAIAYTQLGGSASTPEEPAPIFEFYKNDNLNTLTLTYKDTEATWDEIRIIGEDNSGTSVILQDETGPKSGEVTVGSKIEINDQGLSDTVVVTITHISSSTLMGEYTFEDVIAVVP